MTSIKDKPGLVLLDRDSIITLLALQPSNSLLYNVTAEKSKQGDFCYVMSLHCVIQSF